jgi:hypothetical protein
MCYLAVETLARVFHTSATTHHPLLVEEVCLQETSFCQQLWTCLYNGAIGKIVDIGYTNKDGPKNREHPAYVVVDYQTVARACSRRIDEIREEMLHHDNHTASDYQGHYAIESSGVKIGRELGE